MKLPSHSAPATTRKAHGLFYVILSLALIASLPVAFGASKAASVAGRDASISVMHAQSDCKPTPTPIPPVE